MEYQSPGGAFASGIEDMMMQQAALKRQAMLDDLAQRKEGREQQSHDQDIQLRREEMEMRREEHAATLSEKSAALADKKKQEGAVLEEKGRTDTVNTLKGLIPGDVLSTDMVADVQKHHLGDLIKQQPGAVRLGQTYDQGAWKGGTSIPVEPAESQNHVNKGTPEQQLAAAQPPGATHAKVHVQYRDPKTGQNMERWMSEEDAVKLGVLESPTQPKPPSEPREHFTVSDELDTTGRPTGKKIKVDTNTGHVSYATLDGIDPGGGRTKAPPGAAAAATRTADSARAVKVIDLVSSAIDEADKKGVIGPEAGRYANVEQWIGDPDVATTHLGLTMRAAKLYMDAAVGGVRAAGNARLAEQWDQFLSNKMTAANLRDGVKVMRQVAQFGIDTQTSGMDPGASAYDAYLQRQK